MKKAKAANKSVVSINRGFHIQAKTTKQGALLSALQDASVDLVVATGSGGAGKTYVSCSFAASEFLKGSYNSIVLVRPNVPTGRSVGFIPGDLNDKLAMWLAPALSVLKDCLTNGKYEYMLNKGQIKLQPLEAIRGCSFENAIVIVDEAQNLTKEEIKALSTRIGEGSKLLLLGDPCQKDLRDSGLIWFTELCNRYELPIAVVEFDSDDIVRSGLTKSLIKAFEQEEK